jgi:NAD(P)-dependent dehydrogenase (short-subunit alcohol dehydrogenase family)
MSGHCSLDVLVNNAGITRDTTFKKIDKAVWDMVIETKLDRASTWSSRCATAWSSATGAYVEALTLELKKGGSMTVARSDQGGVLESKPGQKPGGVAGRQVTIVADVVDVDPAKQSITLRGPKRTVELVVFDPAQFKLIAKGDQVEAKYTQAFAIAVEPVAKK